MKVQGITPHSYKLTILYSRSVRLLYSTVYTYVGSVTFHGSFTVKYGGCMTVHVLMYTPMGSTVNIRWLLMAPLLHSNPINHWIKLKTSSDAGYWHAKNQWNHWMVGLWSTGLVPIRALLLLPFSDVLDALSFEPCSAKWLQIKPLNPIRLKL